MLIEGSRISRSEDAEVLLRRGLRVTLLRVFDWGVFGRRGRRGGDIGRSRKAAELLAAV